MESRAAETITINSVGIGTGTFLAIRSYNIQYILHEKNIEIKWSDCVDETWAR